MTNHNGNAGSIRWMSPERLDPDREDERLEPASDVWAFGCLCIMVSFHQQTCKNIANGFKVARFVAQGGHPSRPQDDECHGLPMPAFIWDIAEQCWELDPSVRPTMQFICKTLASDSQYSDMQEVSFSRWRKQIIPGVSLSQETQK